jgi:hypothetical protein
LIQLLAILCNRYGKILLDAVLALLGGGEPLVETGRQASTRFHIKVLKHGCHNAAHPILDFLLKTGQTRIYSLGSSQLRVLEECMNDSPTAFVDTLGFRK